MPPLRGQAAPAAFIPPAPPPSTGTPAAVATATAAAGTFGPARSTACTRGAAVSTPAGRRRVRCGGAAAAGRGRTAVLSSTVADGGGGVGSGGGEAPLPARSSRAVSAMAAGAAAQADGGSAADAPDADAPDASDWLDTPDADDHGSADGGDWADDDASFVDDSTTVAEEFDWIDDADAFEPPVDSTAPSSFSGGVRSDGPAGLDGASAAAAAAELVGTVSGSTSVLGVANAPGFFGAAGFGALGVSPVMTATLAAAGITRPTAVQSRGIPAIAGGVHVVLGAATGSGKTLAYLVPIVEALKAEETLSAEAAVAAAAAEVAGAAGGLSAGAAGAMRAPRRPRALVLAPTRELAEQVLAVAKSLAHGVKFRVVGAIGGGGNTLRRQTEAIARSPVDVLVATTGRLLQMAESRAVDLRFVRHVVVDEVDTLLDAGFEPDLRRVWTAVHRGRPSRVEAAALVGSGEGAANPRYALPPAPQLIAVGATHPRAVEALYEDLFPGARRVEADLHRPPPGLTQRFIPVAAGGKVAELTALLGEASTEGLLRGGRIMIFTNTVDSCRWVDHFLVERGYTTSCVHGSMPPPRRDEAYDAFRAGRTQLLIATDVAARGLDNLAVDHVILFDFPSSAVEYLHRAGRTARAGARGRVTSLVTRHDGRLAAAIEAAARGRADALEGARAAREAEAAAKRDRATAARLHRERVAADRTVGRGAAAAAAVAAAVAGGVAVGVALRGGGVAFAGQGA
ncbi:hypothetical protein MMPV_002168 [Pyropia vietnamensis]